MSKRIPIVSVLLLLATACNKDQGTQPPENSGAAAGTSTEASGSRLTFDQALSAAAQKYPDAPALEVELENEDGKELMEVEFLVGEGIKEVYLDPSTGAVVSEEDEKLEGDEKANLPTLQEKLQSEGVALADAIKLATSKYDPSTIKEIELEIHDGGLVLEVAVADANGTTTWILDPKTGEVRGQEKEEHDEAGEEKEDDEAHEGAEDE